MRDLFHSLLLGLLLLLQLMLFVVLLLWVFCLLEGLWCHQHNSRLADWSWYSRPWSRETMIIVISKIRRTDYASHPLSHKEKQISTEKRKDIFTYTRYISRVMIKFYQNFNLNLMIIGAPAKPRLRFTKNHIKKCKIVHTLTKFSIQCLLVKMPFIRLKCIDGMWWREMYILFHQRTLRMT